MTAPRPIGAVVQARMGSTRLPGKVLLPIGGQPVLALLLERLRQARTLDLILVATTTLAEDDAIVAACATLGVPVFRGSPHDVLDRYREAARVFGLATVVRITADCPLVDPELVDAMVTEFGERTGSVDLVTNRHPLTFPDGLDVDVMSRAGLERAWIEATAPHQREHTIPYFWEGGLRVHNVEDPTLGFERHRWTLDYAEDYTLLARIVEAMPDSHFGTADVLAFLAAHPELAQVNACHMPPRATARAA